MPNPHPLHIRMLRACEQSYKVRTHEDIGLDWLTQTAVIGRNLEAGLPRDLAMIGKIPEGILVCCRGTQLPSVDTLPKFLSSFDDWLNNTRVTAEDDDRFPGQVHEGFADSALDLWRDHGTDPGIKARLEQLIERNSGATIYLTGHSKGGALANLIASLVLRLGVASDHLATAPGPVEVVSFAAARPGNKDFGDTLLLSNITVTRYEVKTDIVPKLPPSGDASAFLRGLLSQANVSLADSLIDYQPVGDQVSNEGQLLNQLADVGSSLFSDNQALRRLIRSHDIKPGSLYDRLVSRGA